MEHNFCRRCGSPITSNDGDKMICESGHDHFGGPIPGAGIFIIDDQNNMLMTVRANDPGKDMLNTLGGFSKRGETAEQTAIRETEEESGLTPKDYQTLQYLCSSSDTYPYQDENRPTLTVFFWTNIKSPHVKLHAGDDAAELLWLPIEDIDPKQVAGQSTRDGLAKLREILGL